MSKPGSESSLRQELQAEFWMKEVRFPKLYPLHTGQVWGPNKRTSDLKSSRNFCDIQQLTLERQRRLKIVFIVPIHQWNMTLCVICTTVENNMVFTHYLTKPKASLKHFHKQKNPIAMWNDFGETKYDRKFSPIKTPLKNVFKKISSITHWILVLWEVILVTLHKI